MQPGGVPDARFGLGFEVLATIATSSTARVELCRSLGPRATGQLIAVKRPLPEALNDESLARRFLDEVWMTAALRDPNVVAVVGWGQDDIGPYLAVELVQGVSLGRLTKSVIDTGEQFPERLVVYIGVCVARGLAAAHELRTERGDILHLVHRDISAQNVLIGFQGEVKITDFGLAKAKERLAVTTTELPKRNMGHIAPEELSQQGSDHRADIFALGVMLYELATNRAPFTGKDEIDIIQAVLKKQPTDPLLHRSKLDKVLGVLTMRCLEKDPARRPQSAREIAHVLEEWLYTHGYLRDSQESLARFVRRNSMRQMRWFEQATSPRPAKVPSAPPPRPTPPLEALTRASLSDAATNRHDEPTSVGGRPQKPQPAAVTSAVVIPPRAQPSRKGDSQPPGMKRSKSSDAVPAAVAPRARRRDASRSDIDSRFDHGRLPELGDEDQDEGPTVALVLDDKMRQELKEMAAAARPRERVEPPRGPLETVRLDDPETTQDLYDAATLRPQPAPNRAAPAGRPSESGIDPGPPTRRAERPSSIPLAPQTLVRQHDQGPRSAPPGNAAPRPSSRAMAHTIKTELAGLRNVAAQRHEKARVAREAAHRAALAAEEAEASARAAEKALVGARVALELADRGDTVGAARKLKEALAIVDSQAK